LDILGAGYIGHQIAWWKNDNGDPVKWTKQLIKSGFTNATIAYAIDMDKDGDLDVIGSAQGLNRVVLWLNEGGSPISWTEIVVDNNFNRAWPIYAADIDGDTDIDIVGGSSHNGNNEVRWWENQLITSVEGNSDSKPNEFKLEQNYPNPFNPATTIKYFIPQRDFVSLIVYSVLGKEVKNLINEE